MRTTHLTWPSDRFLWAVIESAAWKKSGHLPLGLRIEAADDLPVPIEDLHMIGVPLEDGRLAVCAVSRSAVAGIRPDVASLVPASVPECVSLAVEPQTFEMLIGEFEPVSVRRARLRSHAMTAAVLLLCVALLSVGLVRRTHSWRQTAQHARDASIQLSSRLESGLLPTSIAAEVKRLQSITDARKSQSPPRDASVTLASLLERWPMEAGAEPLGVSIAESVINLSVSVDGDPSTFLAALNPPPGWMLDDPRLTAAGKETRLTLQMRRKEITP